MAGGIYRCVVVPHAPRLGFREQAPPFGLPLIDGDLAFGERPFIQHVDRESGRGRDPGRPFGKHAGREQIARFIGERSRQVAALAQQAAAARGLANRRPRPVGMDDLRSRRRRRLVRGLVLGGAELAERESFGGGLNRLDGIEGTPSQ